MSAHSREIKPFLYTCLGILFLLLGSSSWAQEKAYLIGPRDILTVTITAGGEKQQSVDVTVSGEGKINVPFIGSMKVAGLNIQELEAQITKPLAKDYFVSPEVNVLIKEYHSLRYYISGAVKSPGFFEMTSDVSLMELIAKAGGVLPERGNIAYILRASSERVVGGEDVEKLLTSKKPIKVDLKALLDKGDMSHDSLLQSGDVVYIPLEKALNLAESKIYVEGEVKKPGVYDFQPGLTALNACILAGGFDKFAAPNRARIVRTSEKGQEIIDINLKDVKDGKLTDVELMPGDRINIPETWL